ncbi:Lsr2 family protein [Nonomuraea sp. K274]|uniref:Lsr2 family protein n=1 Tax=Nonomuraea cypriaca TaxID=1187855 RepID=A0A931A9E1_9ACTN|nr:Lsr2 family protein [Nonomuraea cypriaca]
MPRRPRQRTQTTASPLDAPAGSHRRPAKGPPACEGATTAQVRAWAKQHGITVPARGRLSTTIWEQYHASRQ